jgi:hypothetical protein
MIDAIQKVILTRRKAGSMDLSEDEIVSIVSKYFMKLLGQTLLAQIATEIQTLYASKGMDLVSVYSTTTAEMIDDGYILFRIVNHSNGAEKDISIFRHIKVGNNGFGF